MKREMKVHGLVVDPVSQMPVVILRAVDEEERMLPIWVGHFEADAIYREMQKMAPPRPMTHDLLRDVIQGLDATVNEITVCDLREETFYARVSLQRGGEEVFVDSRPSDAIALALRAGCPIFVEELVMDRAAAFDPEEKKAEAQREWLESLKTEDLGKYEM